MEKSQTAFNRVPCGEVDLLKAPSMIFWHSEFNYQRYYVGAAAHLCVISVNASQSDYLPLKALPKALQWERVAVCCRPALNIHLSLELLLTSSRK